VTRPPWLTPAVAGWALYDFANTVFSYAVVTRYFNEWLIEQRGNPDWYVGAMSLVVAVALVLTLPPAGALADRFGARMPFLVGATLLCAGATIVLGFVESVAAALVVGGVALFGFQSALVHYDPLLAEVAPEPVRARVSGLGVGLGYVGVLVALAALTPIVPEDDNQRAFVPTAIFFLVFALPCFVLVRERRTRPAGEGAGAVASAALAQLRRTLHEARKHAAVGRFLLGRFLYVDAVATVIAYMTVYADRVGDLSAAAKSGLLGVSVVFAAAGAIAAGPLVDRHGPRRALVAILAAFTGGLVVTAAVGSAWILWLAGPLVGVTLGTMWTADRVFMLRLSPADALGEFFALYGLVGRLSSGVGPLVLWGGVIWLLADGTAIAGEAAASRVALLVLAGACLAGVLVIRPLSDAQRPQAPA
jgi:UMF1 family MFS transporter